ncbi:uncharacterized protein CDAR_445771 [Caerostris darwini]|uniref:Uncharacterized protein n=1 Tax=Caerostris darwini TaxID=1538125 RepID=A0AAV4WK90_9ARAC|nr:uncharacterized protein CDAR_445771 [Caerostris darwini]
MMLINVKAVIILQNEQGPFPITRSFIPELGLIITQAISPKVPKIPGVLSTWGFLHKPVSGVVLRISPWSVQCHFLQEFLADEVNLPVIRNILKRPGAYLI